MKTMTHRLTDDYLRRLDRAAGALPRQDRRELVADIRSHLDALLAPDATEADVRNALEGLGDPDDIVRAAKPEPKPRTRGAHEIFAILFILVGSIFLPIFGWIIGVGLLLSSPRWSAGQKLLGVLVWPGGLFPLFLVYSGMVLSTSTSCVTSSAGTTCDGDSGPSAWLQVGLPVVLVLPPILVAAYLFRAAGRER
jgi:hypothetical protein